MCNVPKIEADSEVIIVIKIDDNLNADERINPLTQNVHKTWTLWHFLS